MASGSHESRVWQVKHEVIVGVVVKVILIVVILIVVI